MVLGQIIFSGKKASMYSRNPAILNKVINSKVNSINREMNTLAKIAKTNSSDSKGSLKSSHSDLN
jgi:hypothetical protein